LYLVYEISQGFDILFEGAMIEHLPSGRSISMDTIVEGAGFSSSLGLRAKL
jgi:hypothetical protein